MQNPHHWDLSSNSTQYTKFVPNSENAIKLTEISGQYFLKENPCISIEIYKFAFLSLLWDYHLLPFSSTKCSDHSSFQIPNRHWVVVHKHSLLIIVTLTHRRQQLKLQVIFYHRRVDLLRIDESRSRQYCLWFPIWYRGIFRSVLQRFQRPNWVVVFEHHLFTSLLFANCWCHECWHACVAIIASIWSCKPLSTATGKIYYELRSQETRDAASDFLLNIDDCLEWCAEILGAGDHISLVNVILTRSVSGPEHGRL